MPEFKSLEQLENYLKTKEIRNKVFKDGRIREALAEEMSKAVQKVVYDAYKPKKYIRRKENGGLIDEANMHITYVELEGDFLSEQIVVYFENLTTAQRTNLPIYGYAEDSLEGLFITDAIVEGYDAADERLDWYNPDEKDESGNRVGDPRDFISETIKNIKANPKPLIDAIKQSFRKIGFR